MQILSFDVVGLAEHLIRLTLWRGPMGDFFAGQSESDRPAEYSPVDLTGCRLDMKVFQNVTVMAELSTHLSPPQITIEPGVRGRFQINFVEEQFAGFATGIYDQSMKCTFPSGIRSPLWVGPFNFIGVPDATSSP